MCNMRRWVRKFAPVQSSSCHGAEGYSQGRDGKAIFTAAFKTFKTLTHCRPADTAARDGMKRKTFAGSALW